MRWDELFADLQAQAERLSAAEREAEVAERTRIEVGLLTLHDRLREAVGSTVRLNCRGLAGLSGLLLHANPEWLLIGEPAGREALVAMSAVLAVSGIGRFSAVAEPSGRPSTRLGLRAALRGVVRDRSAVRLYLVDATALDGTLDRVGADFLEIAEHPVGEFRRRTEVSHTSLVALSALSALRRDA